MRPETFRTHLTAHELSSSSPRPGVVHHRSDCAIADPRTRGAVHRCSKHRSGARRWTCICSGHSHGNAGACGGCISRSFCTAAFLSSVSVVKYTGTAYLFYLGMKKFRERPEARKGAHYHVKAVPTHKVFAQGTMVNVLNPKTALFFFAFLPQFVSPSRGHVSLQFFTLGMIFALMGWASDSMWAVFAGSAASWLRGSTRFVRSEQYAAGTVYIGLGLATALSGTRHK